MKRCVEYILDFFELYLQDHQDCRLKKSHLYTKKVIRSKHGRSKEVSVPVFDVRYLGGQRKQIFRDLPNDAFDILFSIIINDHPELLGLVMCSAFGGLRPSEACNVRRIDSPLGPGILLQTIDGEVTGIRIDLMEEKNLRSDLVSVGNIKRERIQQLPNLFLDAFLDAYEFYMNYLSDKPYEAEYAPFSVNQRGMAQTYAGYYKKFQDIVRDEFRPACLKSQNPEVVMYGRMLLENNLSPHIFRHWYTVQLVLSGIDNVGTLMFYRGDKTPESSLAYLQNKGDVLRQFRKVNNDVIGYYKKLALEKHK